MRIAVQSMRLGWLDLGADDQRRAREYLSQFDADNTLDELGFGILRDACADIFFPATNTIMTRTRYLVFIPALCLVVEKETLAGSAAARRLTELENGQRESLSKADAEKDELFKQIGQLQSGVGLSQKTSWPYPLRIAADGSIPHIRA